MKTPSLLLSLLLLPLACALGSETAYQALRVVGGSRGQETLNQVISVQGRGGAPQPGSWKVTLADPAARGGVREIDVAHGKIVGEHTPVGAAADAAMDFHKLNLDSEGAFSIVQKEAQKAHVSFDSVDYALRGGAGGSRAPVWAVTLMDAGGRSTGSMRIAADTGAIVRSDLYGKHDRDETAAETRVQRRSTVVIEERPNDSIVDRDVRVERDDTYRRDEDTGDDAPRGQLRVGHRINKALHQAGADLEEFFTGKRTMDRKYRDD